MYVCCTLWHGIYIYGYVRYSQTRGHHWVLFSSTSKTTSNILLEADGWSCAVGGCVVVLGLHQHLLLVKWPRPNNMLCFLPQCWNTYTYIQRHACKQLNFWTSVICGSKHSYLSLVSMFTDAAKQNCSGAFPCCLLSWLAADNSCSEMEVYKVWYIRRPCVRMLCGGILYLSQDQVTLL